MTTYQVILCDDTYAKQAYLDKWQRIGYAVALNAMCGAQIDLSADDDKISSIALMQRLRIVRDGVDVFGGLLSAEGWTIGESAPAGDLYTLDALDHAVYLDWRTIPRPAGEHFDTVTDNADDVAKSFVRRHVGSSASAGRPFTDVTVQADAAAAGSTSRNWVGGTLLEHLQTLAASKSFYWRFVPGATGAEFKTAYPLWGLDRSRGNGVNDELVFSLDRRNVRSISYRKDLLGHYNHMYMAGAGEGKDQVVVERANSTYVTAYKRRERWISATQYTATADLQDEGDAQIAGMRPLETMAVIPWPGVLTPANLGDKCTVYESRYGRTFEFTAIIVAISFEVTPDGIEVATPEMVAV